MPVVGPYATEQQPLTQSERGRIYVMLLLNSKESIKFNISNLALFRIHIAVKVLHINTICVYSIARHCLALHVKQSYNFWTIWHIALM